MNNLIRTIWLRRCNSTGIMFCQTSRIIIRNACISPSFCLIQQNVYVIHNQTYWRIRLSALGRRTRSRQNFCEQKFWRRERDSNPRLLSGEAVFKTAALNRSAIPPWSVAFPPWGSRNHYLYIEERERHPNHQNIIWKGIAQRQISHISEIPLAINL